MTSEALLAAGYNIALLEPLARYLRDIYGEEEFRRIVTTAGVEPASFDGKNHWISSDAFEKVLTASRALVSTEEEFREVSAYKYRENFGPMRMVLLAATPAIVLQLACKTLPMVCRIGKQEVVSSDRTHLHMRITVGMDEPYSRQNCLARQGSCCALSTFFGLPAASVREEGCIARGDASCDLYFTWMDQRRWIPIVAGAAVCALLCPRSPVPPPRRRRADGRARWWQPGLRVRGAPCGSGQREAQRGGCGRVPRARGGRGGGPP